MSNQDNGQDKLLVKFNVGDDEVKLSPKIVQDFLTNGVAVSMPEYKMFTELCKARKLNPFLKEAYIIKYGSNPAQIVVGKDAILKRAIKNPDFNGREQGIIVINLKGEIEHRKGTFKLKDEDLVGGWAKVYRKNWDYPVEITVSFDEVAQKKGNGDLNSNWSSKGATMVEKVALVRALREAFTEDLGGMVDESESYDYSSGNRESITDVEVQKDPLESKSKEDVITEVNLDEIPV